MKNLLLSAAIGDIVGSTYEDRWRRTKDYDRVELMAPGSRFTDDTVCTFACAEALTDGLDVGTNLWKCCDQRPMAYAYYKKIPNALVGQTMRLLPKWMIGVNERFDAVCGVI